MPDEMITMDAKQLAKELDDLFLRLIDARTWKSLSKDMREKDVYSIRKENEELVEAVVKNLSAQDSVAAAKAALESESDDVVYLIGERIVFGRDYLSTIQDIRQWKVPQSGRERFLWLLLNKELSSNSDMSYYNW